jgi:hypothetical protein
VPPVGREVGPAVEDLALGGEEGGEWPAALLDQELDGALVARVHVGPLVAVHLDADEMPVEEVGERRVLVGLAVHHVAPVAPDGADVEQHGSVGAARGVERVGSPGEPVDGLVRGALQVGRRGAGEAVLRHAAN